MNNIFEYATRHALRFPFKGNISTEELWQLSLTNLDTVFKTLNKEVKQSNEESLLATKTKEDEEIDIKITIVKHIFETKKAEMAARLVEKENKEKLQKLAAIKAQKEDEALYAMSIEELEKAMSELS